MSELRDRSIKDVENNLSTLEYDFEYIARSLGLVPFSGGAFNPGSIVDIEIGEDGRTWITLHGAKQIFLSAEEMIQLEATIKRRETDAKARQQEAIREQLTTQHATVQELNRQEQNRIQQGMIIGAPPGKKGRI